MSSSYPMKKTWMFDEVYSFASQVKARFSDSVKDGFGHSITLDVFEPILQEIKSLQQMEEQFVARAAEIDRITEEVRSIGTNVYG